jgi:Terminase large subunit, T4likevirus-type, N-terminal/Terminase RNaseH-like domain
MVRSLEGVLVKKANKKERYTEKEVEDLRKCLDPDTGPFFFMKNFFYIQHPVKGQLLFAPFEYQDRLVASYHNNRFNVNMLPRQSGKTTCAAGYLLWYAMFVPNSTILIAAHKYTGSQEIMQRVRYAYELCPNHIRCGVTSYNKGSIEFDNGSRIVSATTTENTGRGMSISLLYCDEFAFVPLNVATAFWTSISPTISTGGRAIITSTPNSDEDTFALIWAEANKRFDDEGNETELGVNGFSAFQAYWHEHPDRGEEWKQEEMGRIGEERFRREYNCEFLIYDETLINSITLSEMQGIEPKEKLGQVRWYKKINPQSTYLIALDPALGTGGNNAALQIFELPCFDQVGEWYHNNTPMSAQIRILREICNYIKAQGDPQIYWSVENNTIGEAALVTIRDIGEENIPGLFLSEPIRKGHVRRFRKGFNTTHKAKMTACVKLKSLIESKKMKIFSKPLISELKNFVATGVGFRGKNEESDDLVSATLLICRMGTVLADWDPTVYQFLSEREEEEILPMPIFVSNYIG